MKKSIVDMVDYNKNGNVNDRWWNDGKLPSWRCREWIDVEEIDDKMMIIVDIF